MTVPARLAVICAAAFTLVAAPLYRRAWRRIRGGELTPTGFGVFLAPILFAGAWASGAPWRVVAACGMILAATMIYWLDDAVELSARLRLFVSFAAGALVCALVFTGDAAPLAPPALICLCLAAGLLNIVMTNIVNFYDGADLNLAVFMALFGLFLLVAAPSAGVARPMAGLVLAFAAPFALFNRRPKTIYLGDSGAFAFASLLTLLILLRLRHGGQAPLAAAIPAALPAFDVFAVLCIRIARKQDLLSRNYLHLYQRLNARYRGFGYLAPQLANAAAVLAGDLLLRRAGLASLPAMALAIATLTPITYFACRRRFLD